LHKRGNIYRIALMANVLYDVNIDGDESEIAVLATVIVVRDVCGMVSANRRRLFMHNLHMQRWTGAFGVAGFVVFLVALPLYFVGPQPMARLEDSIQFSDSVSKASTLILTRTTLCDPLIMACLLVFLAGFRRLIRQVRPDEEWISTLVFGVGLVVITLELAGDALQGGAALDTSVRADPTVVRGLWEGSFVFYGAIGLMMSALLLASAGYATLSTGVLSRWVGWAACVSALVNLVAAPSIFWGTDYTGFYTASGYVTFIGQGVMVIWFLIASIEMLVVKREVKAEALLSGGAVGR
jgi:hypothetical protein